MIVKPKLYFFKLRKNILPELSLPFSGLPLEYIVANLPSNINRNHPFEPFDNSSAAESDQTYKQSRPRQMLHSRQWYALPCKISLASSNESSPFYYVERVWTKKNNEKAKLQLNQWSDKCKRIPLVAVDDAPPAFSDDFIGSSSPVLPINACTLENTPKRAKWSKNSSCVFDISSSMTISTTKWPSSSSCKIKANCKDARFDIRWALLLW